MSLIQTIRIMTLHTGKKMFWNPKALSSHWLSCFFAWVLPCSDIDILGISELKWTRMGKFNSHDHYIYYCGQESHKRNGVALIVNKIIQNTILGCDRKNDRMISVHFQGKSFNITLIQVCAPTTNANEAEAEWFYDDLQD